MTQTPETQAPGGKILLVEDSKFLSVATERALLRHGHQVLCAADGEEALRVALAQAPDLILLDMMLPKMTGPDVLKALKSSPATRAIPVMVLTSLSQKNARQLEKDGAIGFFEKNDLMLQTGPDSLASAIDKILK